MLVIEFIKHAKSVRVVVIEDHKKDIGEVARAQLDIQEWRKNPSNTVAIQTHDTQHLMLPKNESVATATQCGCSLIRDENDNVYLVHCAKHGAPVEKEKDP